MQEISTRLNNLFLYDSSEEYFQEIETLQALFISLSKYTNKWIYRESDFQIRTIDEFINYVYRDILGYINESSTYKHLDDNIVIVVLDYNKNELPNNDNPYPGWTKMNLERSFNKDQRDQAIKMIKSGKQIQIEDRIRMNR